MAISGPFDRPMFVQSVKTSGSSSTLAKGQLAVVDLKTTQGLGGAIVGSFAGYPKDDKRFVLQTGSNGKEATRSLSDKGMRTPQFSLSEIKKLTATVPSRTEQIVDDVVIGYNGFDANTAFKLKKGQAPFRLMLKLSGGPLDYRGGGAASEEILEFVKEVPGCDPYENCEECDECEAVDCRTFFTEFIEQIKSTQVVGGHTVSEFVNITPVFGCTGEGEPETTDLTYYTLTVCDTGDNEALNLVQAQYDFPVVRIKRVGGESTYQVLAASAPDDYAQTIGSIVKGCTDCPEGWDEIAGGYVYAITIEDNGTAYTTQITNNLAPSKYVANSLIKSGNSAGVGFYTAVFTSKITKAEIDSFTSVTTNNRNTATVGYVNTKQALCEDDTVTETAWVEGDSCQVTTQKYSIVLPDNECGESRLAELQGAYPSALNIAIAQIVSGYSVEGTLNSSAGNGNISVNSVDYAITYATSATATAEAFVTTHAAALAAAGVVVTADAGVLTFVAETQQIADGIVYESEAGSFDITFADSEEALTDDRKACKTRYEATVTSNMVCEECDPIYKDFWVTEAPEAYGQAVWYLSPGQEELNKTGDCLCGIRFRGVPFVLSGEESLRDEVQFTETSTLIQVSAGYNNLEIREAIGHLAKNDYTGIHESRFVPRTHLMGNLRNLEKESRAFFNGEQYRNDYLGRIFRAEDSVIQDNFQQVAQITVEIRHEAYSQSMAGRHSNNNRYHFYVPLGKHADVVSLLNNMAGAAGVAPVQI